MSVSYVGINHRDCDDEHHILPRQTSYTVTAPVGIRPTVSKKHSTCCHTTPSFSQAECFEIGRLSGRLVFVAVRHRPTDGRTLQLIPGLGQLRGCGTFLPFPDPHCRGWFSLTQDRATAKKLSQAGGSLSLFVSCCISHTARHPLCIPYVVTSERVRRSRSLVAVNDKKRS